MDAEIRGALVGYTLIKYMVINLLFGLWNTRGRVDDHVNSLKEAFSDEGVLWMLRDKAIPIIVEDLEDLDGTCVVDESRLGDVENIPFLAWVREPTEVPAAGGNHRMAAIREFHGSLMEDIQNGNSTIETLSGLETLTEAQKVKLASVRNTRSSKVALLKSLGRWLAAVYDGSEIGNFN
jgi:hypothetical protein